MILHAVETGRGRPVVLLHGLFGRAQNLASVARRLAATHLVISLDLRNHGASPHAPGMDYPSQAADVLETLAMRGALPASFLGHSMGGKVAMMGALLAPGQVERLLVADIAPVAYAHHNLAVAQAMLGLELTPGLTRKAADEALSGAVADPDVRAFLLQNLQPGAAPAWRIGLAEIAAGMAGIEGFAAPPGAEYGGPTLFVRGGNSNYVLPVHQAAIEALFPAAQVETIAGAGHWLHADQPDAFGKVVEMFMK